MPPKKVVDASKSATGDEGTPAKDQLREGVNIEDLNLPKSIVTRLAKGVLPPNTQIQANAILAMTKSATVFVNYIAAHANELAHRENRKTLAHRDILAALRELEFPDWEEQLLAELETYTEIQNDKRNNYRKKVADSKANTAEGGQDGEGADANNQGGEGESQLERDGQPAAKKARLEPGSGSGVDTSEMQDADHIGEHTADEDGGDDEDHPDEADDDDDEGEADHDEQHEIEEQVEIEQQEAEDEALDNGDDSE